MITESTCPQLQRKTSQSPDTLAWGERMQSATLREYNEALSNAPRARKNYVDGGKRSMTVQWKDRGTLVAEKTLIYTRGKVSQEMYSINAAYLNDGDESERGW